MGSVLGTAATSPCRPGRSGCGVCHHCSHHVITIARDVEGDGVERVHMGALPVEPLLGQRYRACRGLVAGHCRTAVRKLLDYLDFHARFLHMNNAIVDDLDGLVLYHNKASLEYRHEAKKKMMMLNF